MSIEKIIKETRDLLLMFTGSYDPYSEGVPEWWLPENYYPINYSFIF